MSSWPETWLESLGGVTRRMAEAPEMPFTAADLGCDKLILALMPVIDSCELTLIRTGDILMRDAVGAVGARTRGGGGGAAPTMMGVPGVGHLPFTSCLSCSELLTARHACNI